MTPQERANQMADLLRSGDFTQVEVAKKYNLTRQRINQILIWFFPEEDFTKYRKSRAKKFILYCHKCGLAKEIPFWLKDKAKFCSLRCKVLAMRKYRNPNEAARAWYQRHKNDPELKAKISDWNRRAALKRKNALSSPTKHNRP